MTRAVGAVVAHFPDTEGVTSSNLVSPTIYFRALYNARFLFWALSSAGEHHLHTVGVAGSNPVAPTIELPGQKLVCFWLFYFADVFIIVIPELFLNLVLNNKREPI